MPSLQTSYFWWFLVFWSQIRSWCSRSNTVGLSYIHTSSLCIKLPMTRKTNCYHCVHSQWSRHLWIRFSTVWDLPRTKVPQKLNGERVLVTNVRPQRAENLGKQSVHRRRTTPASVSQEAEQLGHDHLFRVNLLMPTLRREKTFAVSSSKCHPTPRSPLTGQCP